MNIELLGRADSLQVHWLVFEVLLILTFLLHLLAMNLALGGSILHAISAWRKPGTADAAHHLPTAIAMAINLGVPPLLFVQVLYAKLFYTSSILMGVFWLAVIPLLIIAYYAAYIANSQPTQRGQAVFSTISALLLVGIAFIYTNNMTLMLAPQQWGAYFAHPGGTLLNLSEPTLLPRFLHMVNGAVAVASLGWSLWGHFAARRGDARGADALCRGMRLFFVFSCVQIVLGLLWIVVLPQAVLAEFLGGSVTMMALTALAVALSAGLLVMAYRGRLWGSVTALALTMVVMILLRDTVRGAYLQGAYIPAKLPLVPAISPLLLFLIAFIIGLGILAWMLKLALDPAQRVIPEEQA